MDRLTNLLKMPLAVVLAVPLGALSIAYAQQPVAATPGGNSANDACSNAAAETDLKKRETALLGPEHADGHAKARVHQCRVAKGLEKKAAPSPQVLAAGSALPAATAGQWSNPFGIPVVGITSVLLNTGKVLFWSYNPPDYQNPKASNTGVAYVWDPATRTGHSITPPENIWCGGQTILSDGRVYAAGGNLRYPDPNAAPPGTTGWEGALSNYTFNPNAETWTRQPDMSTGRWYPSLTNLADNRVAITSGFDQTGSQAIAQAVELFVPSTNINGVGTVSTIGTHDPTGLYPYQYSVSIPVSGILRQKILQAGPSPQNTFLLTPSPGTSWSWSSVPNMITPHYGYGNGIIYTDASVAPVKQIVMIAGGENGTTAISNNEWLETTNLSAGWKQYPQWLQARHNSNTVILPDGTLFTVGGNQGVGADTSYGTPLFQAELYNKPASDPTGQWVQMAPNTLQAAYHSSAILLPDATVLLSQDDLGMSPSAASHQAQVYSPPYLFKGARPNIVSAPKTSGLGQTFSVTADTSTIASVVLVAPSAVTHGNDMHQALIKLQSQTNGVNTTVTVPSSRSLVPTGYYMLFIVDSTGIPSVAKFIHIA